MTSRLAVGVIREHAERVEMPIMGIQDQRDALAELGIDWA